MLANILSFIGILAALTIVGLVLASLFGIFALIYLKLKQVSLRIENDPNANPFEHDDKEQFAKE